MDLIALQRHLAVRHLDQLRVEQWRQDVPRRRRDRHIEQPRVADEAPEPAALVPILDNEVAGMSGRFSYFFCGQRNAVPIKAYQFREHGTKLLYKTTVYAVLRNLVTCPFVTVGSDFVSKSTIIRWSRLVSTLRSLTSQPSIFPPCAAV